MRIIIIVMLVATLCYPALINTAVIPSEKFREELRHMMLQNSRNIRVTRAAESKEETPQRNCYNTACGWAVYEPYTRMVEYFIKSTCDCPDKSYKCVRTDDDLSASAYVYRCRQNTTAYDIESPEDAN